MVEMHYYYIETKLKQVLFCNCATCAQKKKIKYQSLCIF